MPLPAVALFHAGIAMAADAAPAAAADAASEAAPEAAQGSRLDEIVVTATKRETNLQKTPVAISVIDDKIIADRHIQSLLDLADGGVPSLRVATFEARQSALTIGIRGIVPFDQNQTARDSGVGVYIDGVYLARSQGLNAALFDVQRIEVLKGPQGTLFGRNTEGGALDRDARPDRRVRWPRDRRRWQLRQPQLRRPPRPSRIPQHLDQDRRRAPAPGSHGAQPARGPGRLEPVRSHRRPRFGQVGADPGVLGHPDL
jgi:hypothetical protein